MTKTKIIFMGTPQFAATVLKGLIDSNQYEILAVVTQPDRKVGRKQELRMTPVKELALTVNLPVLQPEKLSGSVEMTQIMTLLESGEVGIVTAAFGQFLPGKLLDVAQFAVNTHASLLPKYRGGAPVHYAIMAGEKETGVTIMEMIKKMDAGGIYAQKALPITEEDDVGILFEALSLLGKELLLETLPKIIDGQLKAVPQDEALVTFSPNITREQEAIDWQKSAQAIDWQVRGMRPWPIAFTTYQGARWKILRVKPLSETTSKEPGTIIERTKNTLKIACGQGSVLALEQLQPAGKGVQAIAEFLNGSGQKVAVDQKVGHHE